MDNHVREQLQYLIRQYGLSLCEQPKRVEGMLKDLCPHHKRETRVLIAALGERVAEELLNHHPGVPLNSTLDRLVQRLYDELAIQEAAAQWAVESWALVLGVLEQPRAQTAQTAPPQTPKKPQAAKKSSPSRSNAPSPGDTRVTFETVTLNRKGEVIRRETHSAAEKYLDLGQGVQLALVRIPAGSFWMGAADGEESASSSGRPRHPVKIARPFYIGKYPVTQAQWRVLMGDNPAHFQGDGRPVEQVNWHKAKAFCAKLSQHSGLGCRLPSEAEWEYACRAGTDTPFYFGETITPALANYDGNYTYAEVENNATPGFFSRLFNGSHSAPPLYRKQTTPVGQFPPNAFGLYDMHGNVWEWCEDVWHNNYQGAPLDGSVWVDGGDTSHRLLRGGSWYYSPNVCRAAHRNGNNPDYRNNDYGFRVLCSE